MVKLNKKLIYRSAHFVHGYLTALATVKNPIVGLILWATFLIYEYIEFNVKKDKMYPEVMEWLIGYSVGAVQELGLRGFLPNV